MIPDKLDEAAFLQGIVAIPSVSGAEDALAEHLMEQMAGLGYEVRRDAVGNVVGQIGESQAECTIVLLGHMDTVPGYIPVRRANGCLYGRGSVDAKGPLAAFVLAAARAAPTVEAIRFLVVGAVEEEAQSRGAHHLTETLSPPDGVIIGEPGGWEGITLGYKGVLSVEYRLVSPAGHGAGARMPPAEEAVAFWNRLVVYAGEKNGDGRPPRFDTLDPALRSIDTGSDGLQDCVAMSIGVRLPLGVDVEALKQRMLRWAGDARITFPYQEPPFRAEKNTPVVRALLRSIRAVGGQPRFKLKTGTADMNVVGPAWGCPIAAYGPGDSSLDHTPHEHVRLASFRHGVDVLTRALREL